MHIDEETWKDWLMHPCTRALQQWAGEGKQGLMEMWATGAFSAAFDVEMVVKNAGATGACSVYELVRELDYKTIVESDDNGEQFGPATAGQGGTDNGV